VSENAVRLKTVARNPVVKSDGLERPFIALEDIESGTARLLVDEPTLKAADDSVCYEPGDVLFSKLRPYLAKSYLAEQFGTATSELMVLRPGQMVEPRFLLYVTSSRPWIEWAVATSYGSKMPRTSWEAMAEYRLWLPSIEEQRRIADFLDRETDRSQHLLKLRERQLAGARERYRAQLVTTMLPLEEQCHRLRLKYLFDFSRSGVWGDDPTGSRDDVVCVRVADFDRFRFKAGRNASTLRAVEWAQFASRKLRFRDVLLEKSGGGEKSPVGFAVNFDGDAPSVCSNFVGQLRPARENNARYVGLLMAALYASGRNVPYIKQTTGIQNLDGPGYLSQEVEVPSCREQKATAKSLDKMLDSLQGYSAAVGRQVACLQERRQALITAAVTGQIDVTTARGVDV